MKALLYQLDAMSRRLVAGVLEGRSCSSMPVFDRAEALAAVQSGRIDMVLADTQKNGLELIHAIRAHERAGHSRVPIIALAIADTPASRSQCTEAGADSLLPIPVRASDLVAVLDQTASGRNESQPRDGSTSASFCPALDVAAALERVEGDRALLEELLRIFVDECQSSLRQIRDSWSLHDARALGRLAHTLKGSSANIGANGVSEAALVVERLARLGNLEKAVQPIANLEREIERLAPELDSFLKQTAR